MQLSPDRSHAGRRQRQHVASHPIHPREPFISFHEPFFGIKSAQVLSAIVSPPANTLVAPGSVVDVKGAAVLAIRFLGGAVTVVRCRLRLVWRRQQHLAR